MHFALYFRGEIHFWYPWAKLKQLMYFIYMHIHVFILKRGVDFCFRVSWLERLTEFCSSVMCWQSFGCTLCAGMPGINTAVLATQHMMWDGIVVDFFVYAI